MKIIEAIILLFFIGITLNQIRFIKKLIISVKKRLVEVIVVLCSVIIFIGITYIYGNSWIHYIIGILGSFMFISMWIKQGIYSKGFISMYKYKEVILWNEIHKVRVINSKDIKINVFGGFMKQTFHFRKSDYDKIISMLKENLSKEILDIEYVSNGKY